MNRTEKLLWDRTKSLFPGVISRVENGATPGYPDVHGIYNGSDYWVELKVTKTKFSSNIVNAYFLKLFQESQVVWALKRIKYARYRRLFLLVGFKSYMALYRVEIINGLWIFDIKIGTEIPLLEVDKIYFIERFKEILHE